MMMMKAEMRKMYRVFDELHADKAQAQAVLSGWEHKERITEVFAVGYNLTNSVLITDLQGIYLAKTESDALEEMAEMNS